MSTGEPGLPTTPVSNKPWLPTSKQREIIKEGILEYQEGRKYNGKRSNTSKEDFTFPLEFLKLHLTFEAQIITLFNLVLNIHRGNS